MQKANVTLLDYDCGNIFSITKAIESCGTKVTLSKDPEKILEADKLILPGVGAFGHCVQKIQDHALYEVLQEFIASGKPVLGICVGMQMLLTKSLEYGEHAGLNYISGTVSRITHDENHKKKKVPFVGWAQLELFTEHASVIDLSEFSQQWFYFVHSYVARPTLNSHRLGIYKYFDEGVTAIIAKDNVVGCQFHPEKSGAAGLKFLERFLKL